MSDEQECVLSIAAWVTEGLCAGGCWRWQAPFQLLQKAAKTRRAARYTITSSDCWLGSPGTQTVRPASPSHPPAPSRTAACSGVVYSETPAGGWVGLGTKHRLGLDSAEHRLGLDRAGLPWVRVGWHGMAL